MLSDETRAKTTKYRPYVHIYDLYDIQEKIAMMCDTEYNMKQRNFHSLFSAFALKGAGKEKQVPFSYVYRIARRERLGRDSRDKKEYNPVLHQLNAGPSVPSKDREPDPFVDQVVEDAMT